MAGEQRTGLLQLLEDFSFRVSSVQEDVLIQILASNVSKAEYLNRHGLFEASSSAFRRCLPLVTYEDISKDIKRIADGDESPILCTKKITNFFLSTGTSSGGKQKLLPRVEDDYVARELFCDLGAAILYKYFPFVKDGKSMRFQYTQIAVVTPSGKMARFVSSRDLDRLELLRSPNQVCCTSPDEVFLCTDIAQVTYCHLLCGLIQYTQVTSMVAVYASGFVRAIKTLKCCFQDLAQDIRTGTLNITISDPTLRQAVGRILQPNSELADAVLKEFEGGSLKGIIRRLWPNCSVIQTIVTGSMQQYVAQIDFLSGGIQIASMLYASSECYMGVNLNPLSCVDDISYMLLPSAAYYEFLPANKITIVPNLDTVNLADVKMGEEYELVITTYAGLYRYRVGDILKVTGFHNKAPLFAFVSRSNVMLSVDVETTSEKELQFAIDIATRLILDHNGQLLDYSSYADISSHPPHYVIFWEVDHKGPLNETLLEQCCHAMESSFGTQYRMRRNEQVIGPLEIRVLEQGSFSEIVDYIVGKGGSLAQFKQPRCLKDARMLQILESRVYHKAWSKIPPAYP